MRLDHLLSKEKDKSLKDKVYCLFFNVLLTKYIDIPNGDIAQLARAPALQAGGQGFDSLYLHHKHHTIKMYEDV